MQTQHKVQLDARDKGQAPAGQSGPYQVSNALPVFITKPVLVAALYGWCAFYLESPTSHATCASQSASKQISVACSIVSFSLQMPCATASYSSLSSKCGALEQNWRNSLLRYLTLCLHRRHPCNRPFHPQGFRGSTGLHQALGTPLRATLSPKTWGPTLMEDTPPRQAA